MRKIKKKAQEEMMGFIVIVVILVVVGVVFLAFSIGSGKTQTVGKQQELSDLTWAVLSYTSDCSVNNNPLDVWNLAKRCNGLGGNCDDGSGDVCVALNSTIHGILTTLVGNNITLANKLVHGYMFRIDGRKRTNVSYGNITGKEAYFTYLTFIPPDINVTARFYYS